MGLGVLGINVLVLPENSLLKLMPPENSLPGLVFALPCCLLGTKRKLPSLGSLIQLLVAAFPVDPAGLFFPSGEFFHFAFAPSLTWGLLLGVPRSPPLALPGVLPADADRGYFGGVTYTVFAVAGGVARGSSPTRAR